MNLSEKSYRLSPATRELARRMLSGENGRCMTEQPAVFIDDAETYKKMSREKHQMCCVQTVARKAPIR